MIYYKFFLKDFQRNIETFAFWCPKEWRWRAFTKVDLLTLDFLIIWSYLWWNVPPIPSLFWIPFQISSSFYKAISALFLLIMFSIHIPVSLRSNSSILPLLNGQESRMETWDVHGKMSSVIIERLAPFCDHHELKNRELNLSKEDCRRSPLISCFFVAPSVYHPRRHLSLWIFITMFRKNTKLCVFWKYIFCC